MNDNKQVCPCSVQMHIFSLIFWMDPQLAECADAVEFTEMEDDFLCVYLCVGLGLQSCTTMPDSSLALSVQQITPKLVAWSNNYAYISYSLLSHVGWPLVGSLRCLWSAGLGWPVGASVECPPGRSGSPKLGQFVYSMSLLILTRWTRPFHTMTSESWRVPKSHASDVRKPSEPWAQAPGTCSVRKYCLWERVDRPNWVL
jgi:hypothetical protein